MAPHPISLPCALAFPPTSHRDASTPSPCWAPHFMTQECILFSNSTPSELRLSSTAMMGDDMLSALTPPLHCPSILQPATPPQILAFVSLTISAPICLNRFTFAESQKPDIWSCVCVFTFSSSAFASLTKIKLSFESLITIWSLSPQRFHDGFYLSIVSWQYQKYWTILILVLCLLRVMPLVCSSYSSFAPSPPFFSSWWQKGCEIFTNAFVLQCSPSTSSRQPQTRL